MEAHPCPPFVDWLTISQEHFSGCPGFVGGRTISFDADGTEEWRAERHVSVDGSPDPSSSSRIMVRSDGHRVSVSGNPSKFGRSDNVFGCDLAEAVAVFNLVLRSLGLPEFAAGERHEVRGHNGEPRKIWSGARVSRMDLTRNYFTGSDADARVFVHSLQGEAVGRYRASVYGETTAMFGSGRRFGFKVYLKGPEMSSRPVADVDAASVAAWATISGLVRAEVTLRSLQLATLGCAYLGDLLHNGGMSRAIQDFEKRAAVLERGGRAPTDDFGALPRAVEGTARRWLAGLDVRAGMTHATFYRHRRLLLPFFDIAGTPPERAAQPVRTIVLRELPPPAWYSFERKPLPWAHLPPEQAREWVLSRCQKVKKAA